VLSAIIHRTVRCTPDSVRCSKEARPQELASLGNAQQPLRYNSPDMSGVHRTVRCTSGAAAISTPTATCDAFNARAARAEGRRAHTGAPDNEQECTGHPGGPISQELQRSESNGSDDVAGAPDCPVRHRTDCLHQRSSLVVGAINTPTTPTFITSKFSTSQLLQEL
jgi:hypothetical protein